MKHLLLPLRAIRARAAQARLVFISYTLTLVLFGLAASVNTSLRHISTDPQARVQLDAGTAALVSVGLLTLLILTSSAVALSVRSHIRELAILKGIGFSSLRLVGFVFLETALPALSGSLLGLTLSQPLAVWVMRLFPHGELLPLPHLTGSAIVLALLATAVVSLLSIVVPACRVLRLNVSAALSRFA
ncbi:MAG TPA: FtsX-like permease family protein [Steroidobacteraceae bacterium]|jgi:ABC-type antimicrobial peptide transport system permease subunit|nr:FtsX-like permease family protein [Steroidobacteraceae bacterium]